MTTYDASWNPTVAAAAANEGHKWPSLHPTSSSTPGVVCDPTQVHLGGQAPMFVHADVSDMGLVRLGGQSPMFQA